MAKQTVALEVLSYHATAQQEETDKLMVRAPGWMEPLVGWKYNNDKHPSSDRISMASVPNVF